MIVRDRTGSNFADDGNPHALRASIELQEPDRATAEKQRAAAEESVAAEEMCATAERMRLAAAGMPLADELYGFAGRAVAVLR